MWPKQMGYASVLSLLKFEMGPGMGRINMARVGLQMGRASVLRLRKFHMGLGMGQINMAQAP